LLKEEYEKRYQELSDPNILEKIVSCYLPKIVGEEDNVKLLFCACVSKNLPKKNRLSVIITSQSSAGKSNLVNNVLEPFKEDVLDYTDLFYFLDRMILINYKAMYPLLFLKKPLRVQVLDEMR